jgi:cell division transport system ATP-binding protein
MILFENVTKTYPRTQRPALDDVSLEITRGEFAFVVGTSGSGKSTLLQLVMKEQDATEGRILVAGRDLGRLPDRKVPALRREIGFVFQDFRLLPNKTVHQNVAYALQVLGASRSRIRQTVPETLKLVGLAGMGKRLPHQLSGGEQQRVAIARAFVNRPPILLADEPTGNLDPETSLEIVKLLDRINHTGTTVVMATHDTATVNEMRKRVIRLDQGLLVADVETGEYATGSSCSSRLSPTTCPTRSRRRRSRLPRRTRTRKVSCPPSAATPTSHASGSRSSAAVSPSVPAPTDRGEPCDFSSSSARSATVSVATSRWRSRSSSSR